MESPQPQKPWKVEYAKSSRSSCKTCKSPIEKETLRLGKMVQATQFDGFMPMWNHARCIMKKSKQIKSTDEVEGLELLRWEDQQKIRSYVQSGGPLDTTLATSKFATKECGISVSPTSRATCKQCSQKILKAEVRISSKPEGQGPRGLAWHHANCFMELSPSIEVEKLSGWETLPVSDQEVVRALVKKVPSNAGTKRRKDAGDDQKLKVARSEGDVSMSRDVSVRKATDVGSKLEAQTKELWALKDDLKKHVTNAEMREMLEVNNQDSTGSELDLRERCADGMMFGALKNCPLCSGFLRYSGGMYRCQGYLSAWSKCSYSTQEPERLEGKWKISKDKDNHYLNKWFKSQKLAKPVRILPPLTPSKPSGSQGQSQSSNSTSLADLKVVFRGLPKESTVWSFLRMKLPIVREDYLVDCFKRQKKLPFDIYKVEALRESSSMITVKVKGRSAVHESSGLQDTGHILEDGKSIYNTTLSMSDLSTGVNSYYILQIVQDDKSSDCHVFRKWGRVGNDKIGGSKLEDMSKSDAIHEFKRLFLEKTGNPWEAWEQKQNFQKQAGRFFPLDIDYGVNKQVSKKNQNNAGSKLAPQLAELMKMLFNVETYRAAMMEFEINMSEMPLGKLSKANIQKGFEALTEIQNLLNNNGHAPSTKESLIIDASNRFFTVIPSIHPRVIRDEDDFKSKVKMLEALQDIEIASRLVGFDADSDDSLDEKYKKLRCDIDPIPHDSEDYQLIEKYLLTTHAPTHTFGKGIYFADLVSKSAQYCYTDKKNPVGLMLLSEVALGEVYELKKAAYMDKPPKGKHSTMGLGKKIPQESEYVKWKDDVIVPCGKPVPSNVKASELMYNEYIVYDTAQVKMQYLLKVRFHHKR
ncbi:hypothetical protein DVH24_010631 [Malus domestica]|uniref:Poly [ADP-ribose] polymerase n=1 Tax=Malus domestica TaxID=3750 RepID=A0A498JTD3_MALDO|nr:hypothetical protein DVH24_010631 [Malus domestica]